MKKIYSLLLLAITTVSFGQVFSDDLNYPDNSLLTANGWTAHSGTTNFIDVGASNGLTYTGYSGLTGVSASAVGNAARLDNTGEDVNKLFGTPVTTGTLYFSFLVNVTSGDAGYFIHLGNGTNFAARVYVKPSATTGKINFGISNTSTASFAATPTDFDLNTTYLLIVKYDVSTTGAASLWVKSTGVPSTEANAGTPEHTTTGSGVANIAAVYLRQYATTQNITVDGLLVYSTWFGATPCALTLGAETATCDAVTLGIDTYSVTIPFTGGNTGTYNLTSTTGTIGGDNPSTTATGNITISGINEGVGVTLTITGTCGINKIVSAPECKPVNTLPYSESFPYTVGNNLGAEQKWTNFNAGDFVTVASNSLTYSGVTSSGNSVTFTGAGAECATPFTPTTTGTIYASFLLNVSDLTAVTDGNSDYFVALSGSTNSDYKARLFAKKVGTQYQIGFDTASTTTNYDATLRNAGDVVYVVIGYDYDLNALNLWLNPTNGSAPTLGLNPAAAFITTLGSFVLRQGSSGTTTPTVIFDELRINTTAPLTLGVKQNEISGLKVYPNPVSNGTLYIETSANAEKTVTIFDVLGKQVLNTTTNDNAVNVNALRAGVYVVKITEEGKTATRKLVIK